MMITVILANIMLMMMEMITLNTMTMIMVIMIMAICGVNDYGDDGDFDADYMIMARGHPGSTYYQNLHTHDQTTNPVRESTLLT